MPGVSSRTDRWNGPQTATKPTTHGKQNGSACDATGPSLLTILCCSNCQKDRPANNTALDASLSTWPGRNEGWVCQTRSGDLHQCQPQQVPNQCHGPPPATPPHTWPTTPAAPRLQQPQNTWHHRGPPNSPTGTTHSWFYVPLLLAATGRHAPHTLQQWANHPSAGHIWESPIATSPSHPMAATSPHLSHIASINRQPHTGQSQHCQHTCTQPAPDSRQGHKCIFHGRWNNLCKKTVTSPPRPRKHCFKLTWGNTSHLPQRHSPSSGANTPQPTPQHHSQARAQG